jgi:hypothetical protein
MDETRPRIIEEHYGRDGWCQHRINAAACIRCNPLPAKAPEEADDEYGADR